MWMKMQMKKRTLMTPVVRMTKTFFRLKSCLPEWEEAVLVSPDMGGAKRFHQVFIITLIILS